MSLPECPAPERLASLVEGRAPRDEREELLAHVGACADCHEVFTETADLLDPLGRAQAGQAPWPARQRRGLAPVLALAASALLAAGLAWQWGWPAAPSRHARQDGSAAAGPGRPAPPSPRAGPAATAIPRSAPHPARRPSSEPLPGWIARAPWGGPSSRLGFAPEGAERRALRLGLHLAALDAACAVGDRAARRGALEIIERSLARASLLPPEEIAARVGAATSGRCAGPARVAAQDAGWLGLGRMLEHWRIDAFERLPAALSPERGQALVDRLEALGADAAARRAGGALLASLRTPHATDFERLGQDLGDLIELLLE